MSFYTFMPRLLNMSLTASVAVVLVILLRFALKKAPKVISYALWGIVLFRLLCPFSIGSSFSVFNLFETPTEDSGFITSVIEYVPTDIVHTEYPSVVLPVPGVSDVINEALPQGEEQLRADPLEAPISFATYIWMAGVLVMGIYSAISYVQLRRKLRIIVPLRDNIFIADDIKSPFVVGLFRPRIYLPCNLSQKEQEYIILHEKHHIKRCDHIMKALAFLALAIHWFNPLVWVAFILAGKDMEMSCDEAVIRKVGTDVRADYSASLLTLATGRRIIAGTPLAFGEGDTKGRIHNLSKWKKPAVWIVIISVILCVDLAVCLITNPANGMHLYEIDDSRNYSDLLQNKTSISLNSFGKETEVADLEGFLAELDNVKVSRNPIFPSRSEDRDSTHQIALDGHTYINFSWNYATVWIDNRVKPTYTYMVTNPLEVSQLFKKYGGNNESSEMASIGEIIPGTTYVPYQCIYMNPLSSYVAMGGDSGCKYILGGDYFVTIHRDNGSIISITTNPEQEVLDTGTGEQKSMIEVSDWDWKEFPYSDEEWEALFWPEGIFVVEDIREKYDNILYIHLSSEMFLLNLDGSLWLVNVSNDPKVGTYIWSIYSLVPDSAMGFAQWEFAPMLSSRLPVFRVEFDMEYTSIQATCDNGLLVPWDTPGSSSDTIMTYKEGCALYWSPTDEEGTAVTSAKILFTVMNGDTPVYQGNIYLEGNSGSGGRRIYNASLIGAGMYLSPNTECEGAVITERNQEGNPEGIKLYDLTEGKLEIPIEELGNYAFNTNSTKISLKVKGDQDFEGSFTLIDVSQNNAEIAWKDVDIKDKSCDFTNLTSARIYRLEYAGLEGCTVIISQ